MDTNSKWKYILLGVGAFVVVIVVVYLRVSTYFNIPLVSLLPSNPLTQNVTSASHTPTAPVQRFTLTTGTVVYVIAGKFVTKPAYNAQQVLQGDFVIDGDPSGRRIPVVMTRKTDKITVGRSQGSFDGKTVVGLEDTESLSKSIFVNAPVQLRIYSLAPTKSASDMAEEKVLDGMIAGTWSIPDDFVLHPPMVGVVQ